MALGQDSDEFSVEDDSEEDSEASSNAGSLLHHCGVHSSCAFDLACWVADSWLQGGGERLQLEFSECMSSNLSGVRLGGAAARARCLAHFCRGFPIVWRPVAVQAL